MLKENVSLDEFNMTPGLFSKFQDLEIWFVGILEVDFCLRNWLILTKVHGAIMDKNR